MTGYVLVMILANLVVTGVAVVPLSGARGEHPSIEAKFGSRFAPWIARLYETPIPQDWVGFANQVHRQMAGGPSYLLGERRMTGWRSYYLVALAVKVPLTFWCLLAGRLALARRRERRSWPPRRDPSLDDRSVPGHRRGRLGAELRRALPASPVLRWPSSGSRGWPRKRG